MEKVDLTNVEYGHDTKGNIYIIDAVKKTCKKVCEAPSVMSFEDIDVPELSLNAYRQYIRDRFINEDCPIKGGKLIFRGYRVSISMEDGFIIEDTTKKYKVVDTPWEGIPTPEELGDWFESQAPKKRELTDEEKAAEYAEAVEAGKLAEESKKAEREAKTADDKPVDFEKLRKEALKKISAMREGEAEFDASLFKDFIPFKRWRRKVNALLKQLSNKEIRRPKFLKELEVITTEETFVLEEKRHRSAFKGTFLPEHSSVGYLVGDKLEVDDGLVDAVPFLAEYLLHFEPRCMSQLMKWANGLIDDNELLNNPMEVDWKVDYSKKALKNSAHNAQILTMLFDAVEIIAPQDLLYKADLKVGDVILLRIDGEFKRRTIAKVDQGIEVGKGVGLLKSDRWILAPEKK